MIAVVDYGVGNLFSLGASLKKIGAEYIVTKDKDVIKSAKGIILPGVGAFGDARELLSANGVEKLLCELAGDGVPLMGICLGMQLLFDESHEYGVHKGLGLIEGVVSMIPQGEGIKIPHMGWNSLDILRPDEAIVKNTPQGEFFYFVHSYCATTPAQNIIATADYGVPVTALVGKKNVVGAQFHPEKSGEAGLKMLNDFCSMCK